MAGIAHEIKVSVDEDAIARAAATIREAGKQLAASIGKLEGYAVEPWAIDSPHGKLIGYVDDANQEHWVNVSQVAPARYRKLYVEKQASE